MLVLHSWCPVNHTGYFFAIFGYMTAKTERKYTGKANLPYLLSTTKTLVHCKHYYYDYMDFCFNSKRNRDCYTERNVRINMSRMWHNIIIPNAILCRMYGQIPHYKECIEALNYAMTHGKTERSLQMWHEVARIENSGKGVGALTKYHRSYLFYVCGRARNNSNGHIYELPKDKRYDVRQYIGKKVSRYIGQSVKRLWECPWDDLNMLVYEWKHIDDEWRERQDQRVEQMHKLEEIFEGYGFWHSEKEKVKAKAEYDKIDKEYDDDIQPTMPRTARAIVEKYHVSMTSAQRFKHWLSQCCNENCEHYYSRDVSWALPKSVKKPEKPDLDFIDTDNAQQEQPVEPVGNTENEVDDEIDSAVNAAENRGDRPVAIEEDEDAELPF